ncbi:MAG: hypothetical protein LBB90_05285 [Tannerella sp.]|jgi:hypothetical protein|nr:hypothetical protein [Tannerella sp.]
MKSKELDSTSESRVHKAVYGDSTPESRPAIRPESKRAAKRWTDWEISRLRCMKDSGMDVAAISLKLERSRAAVAIMLGKQRMKENGLADEVIKDGKDNKDGRRATSGKKKYGHRLDGRNRQLYEDKFISGAY